MRLLMTKRVRIGPRLAKKLVEKHVVLQLPNWPKVRSFASLVRCGRWDASNERGHRLVLNQDALILDGIHRLCAVAESGMTYTFHIAVMETSEVELRSYRALGWAGAQKR